MIPFVDLKILHQTLSDEIESAVARVLNSGIYILGPEVEKFEQAFAAYHGVAHAVGVANGTDAIELALRAAGVGNGDEVITVSHTAMPTVTAIESAGAIPVFVDIDPLTYTIDPEQIEAAITPRTRAIIPVHLYGQPADMDAIMAIANRHHLFVLEDCAQAHGAIYKGQRVGTIGHAGTFSFYPTKNLGAYGDGGAVISGDAQLIERIRRLRFYGQSARYVHEERGTNSRLDDVQAAILQVKLRHLDAHNQQRREIAQTYDGLWQTMTAPFIREGSQSVYHLYVVRVKEREALQAYLKAQGIGTLIHYPIPNHLQPSHVDLGYQQGQFPHTEVAASSILSLPLYFGLERDQIQTVVEQVEAHQNGQTA